MSLALIKALAILNISPNTASDISHLNSLIVALRSNMSNIAFVDMANDDYTMTDAQAQCSILVVSNVADMKRLQWPPSSDGLYPSQQVIVTIYAGNKFIIKTSGGTQSIITPSILNSVFVNQYIGAIDFNSVYSAVYNGEQILGAGNTDLDFSYFGKTLVANDALPQTLTIIDGYPLGNGMLYISCEGAGGLTVVAGDGITVVGGSPVLAIGQSCILQRVSMTDTYRVLR